MYAYACNGSEDHTISSNIFLDYIYNLKPPADKMATQGFDVQSKNMLDELDDFRAGFGTK